ncbi:MAG: Gmad2 immunoglobulin-like domain-containing protein [Patescibacteria group bacterium]
MKNFILVVIIIILLAIIAILGYGFYVTLVPPPVVEAPSVVEDEETASDLDIVLDLPSEGELVTSPLVIKGQARVFEGTVEYQIKSSAGVVLASGFTTTEATEPGEFGDFEERIFLPVLEEETFVLEVFWSSPADGQRQDIVTRNLRVKDTGKVSVDVFFVDTAVAAVEDCAAVDAEKRTFATTTNVAELALEELLKGPTKEWASTQIPEFTKLKSIDIVDGVARVVFDSIRTEDWSGGSCHVSAIQAQITRTLTQFPTVDTVEINVNGESENILQP